MAAATVLAALFSEELGAVLQVPRARLRHGAAERALQDDDHRQFGQYMFQSHESSRDFLKNSCEELDVLVELGGLTSAHLFSAFAQRCAPVLLYMKKGRTVAPFPVPVRAADARP